MLRYHSSRTLILYWGAVCSHFSALSFGKPCHSFHTTCAATKEQKSLLDLNSSCHATVWKTVQHPKPASPRLMLFRFGATCVAVLIAHGLGLVHGLSCHPLPALPLPPPPAGTAPAQCPTPVGPLTLTHGGLASEAGQCAHSVTFARVLLKMGCYSITRVAGKPAPVGLRFISLSRLLVFLGCHFINGNWHHVEA